MPRSAAKKRRGDPDEYIILPSGGRFDIPEGEDKEKWIQFFEKSYRASMENVARWGNGLPADGINRACELDNSSHRDGSIYRITGGWHRDYCISNTNETQLEPMILSNPTRCYPNQESCVLHYARPMMQIFSLKLATISVDCGGPVELFGYVATRDTRDALRNYVFNQSRDNPVVLEPGSPLHMTGPKRGISMCGDVLIEYDIKIKKEKQDDDLQLIDGVSDFDNTIPAGYPFLSRIDGVGGAVDITLAMFYKAVEATIQVDTVQMKGSGRRLLLNALVSDREEEIQLFHGDVRQLPGRLVVSTMLDTWLHLKFKFGDENGNQTNEFESCVSFKAKQHGCVSQQIKLDEDYITVKVTWSTF